MKEAKRKRVAERTAAKQPTTGPTPNLSTSGKKPEPAAKRSLLALCLFLAVLNAMVYWPAFHYPFVDFDDSDYIYQNPHVTGGLTWDGISWALTSGHAANWHPLTWYSHMLDVQLYGVNAGPHHVTNVVLHTANTLLLLLVLHLLTGSLWRSAFVAGLFAVHPMHVESVAWVAERKDVLSTLFWMLTLWAYIRYVRQPGFRRYMFVFVFLAFGLMSKPMLVTLPFVLLLLDFWPLGRVKSTADVVQRVREKIPFFGLAAASSIVTFFAQGTAVVKLTSIALDRRVANAILSYMNYIVKMVWPARLAIVYPYSSSISAWWVAAALFLLAMSIVALAAARRRPYVTVGWFWYLGTLVPVIGIVQVGAQSMANRYTYIPYIGLFIIAAWGIPDLASAFGLRKLILPAAVLAISLCTVRARAELGYWQTNEVLWRRAAEVTTDNVMAQNNLANILADHEQFEEAISHYHEALRINSSEAKPHFNFANTLAKLGKLEEANAQYLETLRINPEYDEAHNNLGIVLAKLGKPDEAAAHFKEALRITPDYAAAHSNFGNLLSNQGKVDEAIQHFSEAMRLNPNDQKARRALDDLKSRSR